MRWMWIDQIVLFEPGARLHAIKNVSLAEEHLHDHFSASGDLPAQPIMPASLMIEGMAQTAGILVGAANDFRQKVVLAKVVLARLDEDVFPGQTIRYEATLQNLQQAGAATQGKIKLLSHAGPNAGQWREIGEVDLMFSHLENNLAGLEFPEENFVFSENFRTILRMAGLSYAKQ